MDFGLGILLSGLLGAGATIFGANQASSAQSAGASASNALQQKALDMQWNMYQQQRSDFAPWRAAGSYALEQLLGKPIYGNNAISQARQIIGYEPRTTTTTGGRMEPEFSETGFSASLQPTTSTEMVPIYGTSSSTGERQITGYEGRGLLAGPGEFNFQESPEYQGAEFGYKNFVEKPYLSNQSAMGQRLSGQTLKGLTGYASDYWGTKYSTAYDNFLARYYQKLAPYQSLAGMSVTPVSTSASLGNQTASNIGNIYGQMANTQYQNALAQGNIQTGMAAGLAGVGQNALQNWLNYQTYQNMNTGWV